MPLSDPTRHIQRTIPQMTTSEGFAAFHDENMFRVAQTQALFYAPPTCGIFCDRG